jgi:hypothetical protein
MTPLRQRMIEDCKFATSRRTRNGRIFNMCHSLRITFTNHQTCWAQHRSAPSSSN